METKKGYLLAIDVGTTTTRAVLFDLEGTPVSEAFREPVVHHPEPNWAEVEADDWWRDCTSVVCEVLERSGIQADQILGIGLTALQHTLVPIDAQGNVLARGILWMDQRSKAQLTWLNREHAGIIAELLGRPGELGNSTAVPKLRWMLEHAPEVLQRATMFLPVKDFIRYRLTGTAGTDTYDAASTGLYCQRTSNWFEPILALVGVTLERMPPILEASTIAGHVTEDAARVTGLAAGTPVVTGSGDVNCTCLGMNITDEKQACLYLGTAAWMRIPCPSRRGGTVRATSTTGAALKWVTDLFTLGGVPVPHRQISRAAMADGESASLSPVEAGHYGEGELPGVQDHAGVQVSHLSAEETAKAGTTGFDAHPPSSPGDLYSALVKEAAGVPPGSRGLLFLPHLMGERGPQPDPDAKGTLFGFTMAHGQADIARAVLEGCAFQLLRILEDCGSPELHEITVVGGGAKSPLWLDIIADVLGARLLVPRVLEAGALGAVILAGVGVGAYTDACQAAARLVSIERRHEPDPTRYALYRRIYKRFVALEKSVAPLYDDSEDEG